MVFLNLVRGIFISLIFLLLLAVFILFFFWKRHKKFLNPKDCQYNGMPFQHKTYEEFITFYKEDNEVLISSWGVPFFAAYPNIFRFAQRFKYRKCYFVFNKFTDYVRVILFLTKERLVKKFPGEE